MGNARKPGLHGHIFRAHVGVLPVRPRDRGPAVEGDLLVWSILRRILGNVDGINRPSYALPRNEREVATTISVTVFQRVLSTAFYPLSTPHQELIRPATDKKASVLPISGTGGYRLDYSARRAYPNGSAAP
jgi:hypothetical protein